MDSLTWSATADKDWIQINPSEGTGSQQINVDIIPSQTYNDPDTAGTITFKCTSCEPHIFKTVNVTRCPLTSCGESTTEIEYGNITTTAEQCDTSKTVEIPYTSTTRYTVNGCPPEIITGSDTKTFTFEKNNTGVSITRTFKYPDSNNGPAIITINQAGGGTPCDCTCDSLVLNNTNVSVACEYDTGVVEITTFSANQCFNNINLTPSKNWLTNVRVDGDKIVANIAKNDEDADRQCEISVKYGEGCEKTIIITQAKCSDPCAGKDIICTEGDDCFNIDSTGGTISLKYGLK